MKHLTSESVGKTVKIDLNFRILVCTPDIKKQLYSEKMKANYDCQKSNKSPLMYCQLQDSSFQQVELPGLAQNDLLWPGLLNQDACSTSKICCWTHHRWSSAGPTCKHYQPRPNESMIVVPKMTHQCRWRNVKKKSLPPGALHSAQPPLHFKPVPPTFNTCSQHCLTIALLSTPLQSLILHNSACSEIIPSEIEFKQQSPKMGFPILTRSCAMYTEQCCTVYTLDSTAV